MRYLIYDGYRYDYLDSGYFSEVFVNFNLGLIIKQFCAKGDDERFRKVCNSEVAAYEIAMQDKVLQNLTPKFYDSGLDCEFPKGASENYLPSVNYQLEYVQGLFVKDQGLVDQHAKFFRDKGINYLADCSVFSDNSVIKVIDFATEEFRALWIDKD